jgi:hypothetical protein
METALRAKELLAGINGCTLPSQEQEMYQSEPRKEL